jgi:phospholipase C
LALALLAGCSQAAVSPGVPDGPSPAPQNPIRHVVVVVQENRSFNDLFLGYPGATTQDYGYDGSRKVTLQAEGLESFWDVSHDAKAFFADCDGTGKLPGTHCKMDGWNQDRQPSAPGDAAYSYVPRAQVAPYWAIAKRNVLADRMFTSNLDGSFVAHQYLVAAYSSAAVDYPASTWGCEGGPQDTVATLTARRTYGPPIRACFSNPTLGGEADKSHLSWRFYADTLYGLGGLWSAYQADRRIFYGPDWKADVISPPSQFLTDVAHGKLARITWITPTLADSDHAGLGSTTAGPAWVASVVDAVGESKFWNTTAIFIMWDDWGGWYDPVPPVYEDYDGLGFRVPLLIVSPYAKRGSVTHVQYETASLLRFIEDDFGLPQLAASDTRANDPATDPAVFDFSAPPRKFEPIAGAKPRSFWQRLEAIPDPRTPSSFSDGD